MRPEAIDQPPEAIGEGAEAALAAGSGIIDDDALPAGPLMELELLALMSGAGVVVVVVVDGAGTSAVFEQPASVNTAERAMAESVVSELIRVIVVSCPVLLV